MFKGKDKNYRILGICGSKMPNEDVKSMMDSICRSAVDSGWKVMMFTTFCDLYSRSHETTGEASVYKVINTDIIDALVVLPGSINNNDVSASIIAAAKDGNIPVVTIDGHFDGVPSVMFDYVTTFERIIRHVVEDHHCRTVNFIAGFKDNDFSEARIDCFKRVLAENGIEFDERRLGYGDFWEEPTRRAMDCFVESGLPMPEAIICCNDSMAITVCQYLSEKGYAVPDDVIVTGFDGIELEKFYQPRLTTGCVDYSAVGAKTMEIIGKVLAGDTVSDAVIPYRMHLGGSCGCNKTDSANACDKIIKLYDRVGNSVWHEDYMFSFLRKATRCRNLSELADVMSTHGDYFEWFCLNTDLFSKTPDEARYHDLFTEKMNAFFVRRMENHTNTDIIFPAENILPDLEDTLDKFDVLYFSPLHFMDEVLGYACAAIAFADEFIYSNRRRYISNTVQILENLIHRVKLERMNSELAEMHIRDPLTGLLNRRGFYKKFDKLCGEGKFIYLFSIDMDRLKYINDNFGHNEGDRAIKTVAAALMSAPGYELVCSRFGGDEFAVIASGDDFSPEDYITEVRAYLAGYNRSSGCPYRVEVSVGMEKTDLSGWSSSDSIDDIIRIADARMYEDKRSRKAVRDQ